MPIVDIQQFSYIHSFFFCNDTATTEIYTLSLHDALPIWRASDARGGQRCPLRRVTYLLETNGFIALLVAQHVDHRRSEEHTSELQSLTNLVCRLLLEKKKINNNIYIDQ